MSESADSKIAAKRRVMRAVNRFKRAAIDKSWCGASDPIDRELVYKEYKLARNHFDKVIEELINGYV